PAPARFHRLGAALAAPPPRHGYTAAYGGRPRRFARPRLGGGLTESSATSWAFEERDSRRIEDLLHSFLLGSRARCALLVDRSGQLVATAGEQPGLDTATFAALAAADFAANEQLAAMTGEREFSSLFHQG